MPIVDERRITFDISAIKEMLMLSQFAVMSVGLPSTNPSDIVLKPLEMTATFKFDGSEVTLGFEKLGALLISYCIRAGIRIPRKGKRRFVLEPGTVTLTFTEEYLTIPLLKSTFPDEARVRATSWPSTST